MSIKNEIIERFNEWNSFIAKVDIDELKDESRDEIKALISLLGQDKRWELSTKLRDLEKAKKEAEHPEINGVRYFPELKNAAFLTEEEQITVDRTLRKVRFGLRLYALDALFNKRGESDKKTKIKEFLVEVGIATPYHSISHNHCRMGAITNMLTTEEREKMEEQWKLAKAGNIDAAEWLDEITYDYCDNCNEDIELLSYEKLNFETVLFLTKKADITLDTI